jgi:hypothetical protein
MRRGVKWPPMYPEARTELWEAGLLLICSQDQDWEAKMSGAATPIVSSECSAGRHVREHRCRGRFGIRLREDRSGGAQLKGGGCDGREQLLLACLAKRCCAMLRALPTRPSAGHGLGYVSVSVTLAEHLLAQRSKQKSVQRTVRFAVMRQLFRALEHANRLGVSHLDVRGETVVLSIFEEGLSRFSVRVTGWESAWMTAEGFQKSGVSVTARPELPACSISCRAPELLLGQDNTVLLLAKCDVWSVGCLFAQMLSMKEFFCAETTEAGMLGQLMWQLGTPSSEAQCAVAGLSSAAQDLGLVYIMSLAIELLGQRSARAWSSTFAPLRIAQDECCLLDALLAWDPSKRPSAASLLMSASFEAVRIPGAFVSRDRGGSVVAGVHSNFHVPFSSSEKSAVESAESALRRRKRVRGPRRMRSLRRYPLGSSTLATIEEDAEDAEFPGAQCNCT